MLMERLHHNPNLTSLWLAHQNRDDYWRPGSVCEDYRRIACPVLAVGGWADAYTDAIIRLVDNSEAVVKGLIGPWGHTWPERSVPGPSIGFLQECLRWWDRWLKEKDNGAEDDPRIRYYLQGSCRLTPSCNWRDGTWYEAASLTEGRPATTLRLSADGLLQDASESLQSAGDPAQSTSASSPMPLRHSSPLTCGTQVDTWLPMGSPIDLPSEQGPDDERSLIFDSAVLETGLELAGIPSVRLCVAADQPEAFVFARLCDVFPDGSSHLITRGNLNLTHRDSHEFPEALVPGSFYEVEIPLKAVAQCVPAGHRIRLALSTSYWPWIWPSRMRTAIAVDAEASSLRLPLRSEDDRPLSRPFEKPQQALGEECEVKRLGRTYANRDYDPVTGIMVYKRSADDDCIQETPSGMRFEISKSTVYAIDEHNPLSARMESHRQSVFSRGSWSITTRVDSCMHCTFDDFIVETTTHVSEKNEDAEGRPFQRELLLETHTATIPRCFN
jgi:predicted acyl esterase